MAENPQPEKDAVLAAYTEVCRSYHAVDDFRGRLLAFLPFAAGTGGIFLLANKDVTLTQHFGPIGLFGAFVTLGLYFFELRGQFLCGKFIAAGKGLEKDLYLKHGQFEKLPTKDSTSNSEEKAFGFIGVGLAAFFVYFSVIFAWLYVAYVGSTANVTKCESSSQTTPKARLSQ